MFHTIDRRAIIKNLAAASLSTFSSGSFWGCSEPELLPSNLGLHSSSTPPILGGSPDVPWWLRGNYAPVQSEVTQENLEVIGQLPPELNGTFLRAGSNPRDEEPLFWFFGDGMVHGITFSRGRATTYRSKWMETPAMRGEEIGLMAGRANTNLIYHADKLFALYEISPPFELDPHTLESMGYHDFSGMLSSPMCAHPKIDPKTGEMWFIGVDVIPPRLSYAVVNSTGELLRSESMSLSAIKFTHDFQLTESFVIFYDLPLEINPAVLNGGEMFNWRPEHGARIGLMPRSGSFADALWFEIEPCYTFHSFNAYEEGDEVILEACRVIPGEGADLFTSGSPPLPWQWRFNRKTLEVRETALSDLFIEFPMIDHRRQGQNHRYNYGLTIQPSTSDYPMHPTGIFKLDRDRGKTERWTLDEALQLDEALFVPDADSTGEDEGWLLSVAYIHAEQRSEVLVFNAQSISSGPIARVLLPTRVPFGFHGLWLPHQI